MKNNTPAKIMIKLLYSFHGEYRIKSPTTDLVDIVIADIHIGFFEKLRTVEKCLDEKLHI